MLKRYTEEENNYFARLVDEYRTTTLRTEDLKQYYADFCVRFISFTEHNYTLSQFSAKYYDTRRKILGLPTSGYTKGSPAEKEILSSVRNLVDENKKLAQENRELKMELRKLKEIRQAVENYQKNK